MYKIILRKQAEKYLDKIDRNFSKRIVNAILDLSHFPFRGDIKKMSGKYQGMFRLRVGEIRVLYMINKQENNIVIYLIDNRGDIY